jgi:hypothetical protein
MKLQNFCICNWPGLFIKQHQDHYHHHEVVVKKRATTTTAQQQQQQLGKKEEEISCQLYERRVIIQHANVCL